MRKVVYIVYSSRKGGHRFPALALGSFLEQNYGKLLEIRCINFLDYSLLASWLDAIGRIGDLKARGFWKVGYSQLEQKDSKFTKIYKHLIPLIFANPLMRRSIVGADLIISFQPEMNCLLGSMVNDCPVHTLIVDYSAHGLWVHEKISRYYVASPEVAERVESFGVAKNKILVTGIPLRPTFAGVMKKSVQEQRALLGLERDKPTILLLGGLLGTMVDYYTIMKSITGSPGTSTLSGLGSPSHRLSEINIPYQLLVVFGKNEVARKRCESIRGAAHLYGAISNMAELMWASDLIITKPGSVTIGEALALGKPMVLVEPRAGSQQEIAFAKFVREKGAGISVRESGKVGAVVKELLIKREELNSMAECAEKLGIFNREANENIAQDIMEGLGIKDSMQN